MQDLMYVRRGNQLLVHGDAELRQQAGELLQVLYERLESGRPVEREDIDREIRLDRSDEDSDDDEDELVRRMAQQSVGKTKKQKRRAATSRARRRGACAGTHSTGTY